MYVLVLVLLTGSAPHVPEEGGAGWARVGLQAGAPTGLTAAFDLGSSFVTHLLVSPPSDGTDLGARIDLLYRLPGVGDELAGLGRVSFWAGPGLRWTHGADARSQLGVRVPFGVSLFTTNGGHELYAEIAPALTVFPERRALVEAGVGLRLAVF